METNEWVAPVGRVVDSIDTVSGVRRRALMDYSHFAADIVGTFAFVGPFRVAEVPVTNARWLGVAVLAPWLARKSTGTVWEDANWIRHSSEAMADRSAVAEG